MATLVGVCYISEEHARLSGPPHHRDTLGEGTIFSFLCMCALSLLWPERSRAKTIWRACQDGGLFLVMNAG